MKVHRIFIGHFISKSGSSHFRMHLKKVNYFSIRKEFLKWVVECQIEINKDSPKEVVATGLQII